MHNNTRHLEILDAAAELFFRQGFSATKMIDIARKAGWSKGLAYFYYKNKEDLFIAVLEHALELNLGLLESAAEATADQNGLHRAMALLDNFLTRSIETRHFQEIIIQSMQLTESGGHPEVLKKMGWSDDITTHPKLADIRLVQWKIYQIVKKTIEKGQADGSITNPAPAPVVYLSVWSFIIGFETMLPVMENHRESAVKPKHDYLMIPIAQWKDMILQATKNILAMGAAPVETAPGRIKKSR